MTVPNCWQSDEAYSGTAWLEIGAPVGKALAQLQVTLSLTPHCRVDSFTPEHVQLFIAEEGEAFGEIPIFESVQFWSLTFPGEPIILPARELLPPRTSRAKLCVKRAACGGRNVRLQCIKVLTKRLKRRREDEGRLADRLWSNKEFADIVVRCNDGGELKAHRAVLGIASPVFRCMLNSPMKEGAFGEITLPCSENVVRSLLKHCYGLPYDANLSLEDELVLVEQAHAFELNSLCGWATAKNGPVEPEEPVEPVAPKDVIERICEDAAFSAIERLNEATVVQLVKGLRTFYKAGSLKEEWENLVRQVRASPDLCQAALLDS
ncbi:unnamed protein product [Cladocopium goreaui]|uniref:Speckle-type POZ protein-like n=1 Tax=Cladocopium goreaui TaxID=2562237 RepID=A0A9P1DGB8_9DINO|nr:unnamed protein product [Cladocopium goreaui]